MPPDQNPIGNYFDTPARAERLQLLLYLVRNAGEVIYLRAPSGAGATGKTRRRARALVDDLTLTLEYEKASPKLIEAALEGKVIPKLEIEMTSTYGGARATYLKYELKNVQVTSYEVSGAASDDAPPTVVIGNNFEEIKVTYTEYDNEGGKKGNVEYNWKVEKGEK